MGRGGGGHRFLGSDFPSSIPGNFVNGRSTKHKTLPLADRSKSKELPVSIFSKAHVIVCNNTAFYLGIKSQNLLCKLTQDDEQENRALVNHTLFLTLLTLTRCSSSTLLNQRHLHKHATGMGRGGGGERKKEKGFRQQYIKKHDNKNDNNPELLRIEIDVKFLTSGKGLR